jgi:hypothetical protein
MKDKEQNQKEILLCLSDAVSGLYTQHALVIELLARTLPDISENEKKTLEDNAKRTFAIADDCVAITKLIHETYDDSPVA